VTTLTILVGGAGAYSVYGSGGGGGSFVVNGDTPLVIAGGGGGTCACGNCDYPSYMNGITNSTGGDGCGTGSVGSNGSGGSDGSGGTGGVGNSGYGGGSGGGGFFGSGGSGNDGSSGGLSFLSGGDGGAAGTCGWSDGGGGGFGGGGGGACYASGGGGGYSGGGGGCGGAGGGGGSFINSSAVTIVTQLAGVQSGNGEINIVALSVAPVLTNIIISPASLVIGAGTNEAFAATGYFSDGSSAGLFSTNGLVWSSSNPSVANINTNGLATGLTNGATTITATSGAVSGSAALTVVVAPAVSANPVSATASPGGTVTLSVSANGCDLSYQWQCDATNIPCATNACLTITNFCSADNGSYTVTVSNPAGSVTSQAATLALLTGGAQWPVITSFSQNGVLVCSNLSPGSVASVQWASSLSGPWQTNWAGLDAVTADSNGTITVSVPMFYRVLGVAQGTNAAPTTTSDGMALIPAGAFTMGDTQDGESDAIPTNVYVSAFYMDTNLVSHSQWQTVYNWAITNGYVFDAGADFHDAANQPVYYVDWYDTVKWCNARSQQAGLTPVYYTDAGLTQVYTNGEVTPYVNWAANGYRLPTEAEWEKAARGGLTGQRFPWGGTILESQANYCGDTNDFTYDSGPNGYNAPFESVGWPYTSPVGYFAANGYGLYDMAGNVWEWCWDRYAPPPYPTGSPYLGGTDPRGPASSSLGERVLRGGCWIDTANHARCAFRNYYVLYDNYYCGIGFRCVRGL